MPQTPTSLTVPSRGQEVISSYLGEELTHLPRDQFARQRSTVDHLLNLKGATCTRLANQKNPAICPPNDQKPPETTKKNEAVQQTTMLHASLSALTGQVNPLIVEGTSSPKVHQAAEGSGELHQAVDGSGAQVVESAPNVGLERRAGRAG